MKAFKNLVHGEDDELSSAYDDFHRKVKQEADATLRSTLAYVGKIDATTEHLDRETKTLVAKSGHIYEHLERKTISSSPSFSASESIFRSRGRNRA